MVINKVIPLATPHMSGRESVYIERAFTENWIAPLGPNVDDFERELSDYTGAEATTVSSGTAAIHLALHLLGVTEGDYVLCPTFTFVASINPALYLGAKPIFIDSESESMNISPKALQLALEDCFKKGIRPKALIIVHLYGHSAKMDEIMKLAALYQIPVVEDAAEALGSKYKGNKLGTIGEMGIFSFNGNKIITTSGGGALVSKNSAYVNQARFLASQAKEPAPYYLHQEIGYNYRISNVLAGIGIAQMEVLEKRIQKKRSIFRYYEKMLAANPQLEMKKEPQHSFSNYWLSILLLKTPLVKQLTPEILIKKLCERGIEARRLWNPMHRQPLFKSSNLYKVTDKSIAEDFFERGICLPSGTSMTEEDLHYVTNELLKIIKGFES